MSDLTANDRSSFGMQNVARPKFQPIRVKALLHFCESDDEDEDKSDEKSCESKDESDSDDLQSLPENDIESTSQKSSPYKVDFKLTESKEKDVFLEATSALSEENHKVASTNISITQEKRKHINDENKCETNDVNNENHLPIKDLNKLDLYNSKCQETTDDHSGMLGSKQQQVDIVCNFSTNITLLPPPSLSVYVRDCITKHDMNKNTQAINNTQSNRENACVSDIPNKREEELLYNASADNKMPLARKSENYSLHLNKEDQQHKSMNFTKANKDFEEEHKISNVGLESASCMSQTSGNLIHCQKYNTQCSIAKYEADENYTPAKNTCAEFNTPLLNKRGNSTINNLISETPLKHIQTGSMHSNTYTSHKQLFHTPHSELLGDLSKGHAQISSTTLLNWSYSNMRHTPMEGKNLIAKNCVQTPRNSVYTPIIKKYFGTDQKHKAKHIRRPLVDATSSYTDSLESTTLPLQTRFEVQRVASEIQQEDGNSKLVGLSEIKLMREANYNNDLRLTKPIEEAKENEHHNMPDPLLRSNRKIVDNKKENKQLAIGSSIGIKIAEDSSQKCNEENNIASNAECKELHDTDKRKQEGLRQIVNKVANVQFTVPSSVLSQRQGTKLVIKDKEYLALGSLGRGMSGEVLRVQEIRCGELRAIKCVDLSKMDKESAQGCLDEISLLRKLQAPCVVRMFDYHIKESMVYVVMEMGDTDLSRLLKSMSQEKHIPLTMILYYWTEMLTAVKHIHDNGVIHSDLKPANFLLVRGRLKLIDFGIATNINSDMTSVFKNNTIGTLNYISPEALMDIGGNADSPTHNVKYKISFKSDVWSLGCILYSLVYGHTPFHHIRSQWAKVNAITKSKSNISFPIIRFSSENFQDSEYAPPVLIDVMRKCLQHDPKARPTVSQLLQVQYVPTKQNVASVSVPEISANLLMKIKHTLNEEEWRQLVQVLDIKRHHT